METTPKEIFKSYRKKTLNKNTAIEKLIFIIENVGKYKKRIKSIKYLEQIGSRDEKVFHLLENFLPHVFSKYNYRDGFLEKYILIHRKNLRSDFLFERAYYFLR